jgi:hypothetical protein
MTQPGYSQPWYFEDVKKDHESAHDLEHTLGYGAIGVAEALALLQADIPVVVEDWAGSARWLFDEQMPGILEAGHQLVAVLQATVSAVSAAYENAYAEASLREDLRESYLADAAAQYED